MCGVCTPTQPYICISKYWLVVEYLACEASNISCVIFIREASRLVIYYLLPKGAKVHLAQALFHIHRQIKIEFLFIGCYVSINEESSISHNSSRDQCTTIQKSEFWIIIKNNGRFVFKAQDIMVVNGGFQTFGCKCERWIHLYSIYEA